MNLKLLWLTILVGFCSQPLLAQDFSAYGFQPPIQAPTEAEANSLRKVKNLAAVFSAVSDVTGQEAVKADSAQDAVNAFTQKRTAGHSTIIFPGGTGFAASGISAYNPNMPLTARRLEQRKAYLKAFEQAKRNLAAGIAELPEENQKKLVETAMGDEKISPEAISQFISDLSQGFVIYDVFHDPRNSLIHVTLVATPETKKNFRRPDDAVVIAENFDEGLAQALVQTNNGLTAPIGGLTVFAPSADKWAFIGFGSAAVQKEEGPKAQRELEAEKVALARAGLALGGLLLGESVAFSEELEPPTAELVQAYETIAKDESLKAEEADSPSSQKLSDQKFAARLKEFAHREIDSAERANLRQGLIPAAAETRSWKDASDCFAYAAAVYLPGAANSSADYSANDSDQ
ncbi:MAG: hypothetical protein LBJ64_06130 [Deltaproteobacteria bacterium]|jgi:hypothetical protein|nr:hypothetical protein [Deltaproteobacteria bacterium]